MLESERVDGMVAFFPTSIPEIKTLNSCHEFFTSPESLQCWRSAKNQKVIKEFNAKLRALKSSGELKKIKTKIYKSNK